MNDTPPAESQEAPESPKRHRFHLRWPWIVLLVLVVAPLIFFAVWTTVALHVSYETGNKVGYVLNFAQRGWLCKTWEGELSMATVPGVVPEKWAFSVRSDSVAHAIQALQGRPVVLTYEEHKGVPGGCFGLTENYVTGVAAVGAPTPIVSPAPIPPGSPAGGARH